MMVSRGAGRYQIWPLAGLLPRLQGSMGLVQSVTSTRLPRCYESCGVAGGAATLKTVGFYMSHNISYWNSLFGGSSALFWYK